MIMLTARVIMIIAATRNVGLIIYRPRQFNTTKYNNHTK